MVERRRSPRVPVDGEGSSGVLGGAYCARLRDLSPGGLRLGLPVPLEPGSIHALTALLGGLALSASVRITRCRPEADSGEPGAGGWEAGAELLFRGGADAAALRRWLDGRRPAFP